VYIEMDNSSFYGCDTILNELEEGWMSCPNFEHGMKKIKANVGR